MTPRASQGVRGGYAARRGKRWMQPAVATNVLNLMARRPLSRGRGRHGAQGTSIAPVAARGGVSAPPRAIGDHFSYQERPAFRGLAGAPPESYVARMRTQLREWRRIGAPETVLRWIAEGVHVQFAKPLSPFHFKPYDDLTQEQTSWLAAEKQRLFALGAWEPAQCQDYVSPCFLVPKKEAGQWRLVVDLRHVNAHCVPFPCRYETLSTVQQLCQRGDYLLSLDIGDAFYHIAIHPDDRKYFTCDMGGELVQLAALPMGWLASPAILTKVMRVVVRHLRSPAAASRMRGECTGVAVQNSGPWERRDSGIPVLPYLDDFLFFFRTVADWERGKRYIAQLLARLGLYRKEGKGVWDAPVQVAEHLGLEIDTVAGVFRVGAKRLSDLNHHARTVMAIANRQRRLVGARTLASFAGKAQFCYLAMPAARFFLRSLHDDLRALQNDPRGWDGQVRLSRQTLADLRWWARLRPSSAWVERAIWRPTTTATLHTDASREGDGSGGWGAVLNGDVPARGFWRAKQRLLHITFLELVAVRLGVETFAHELAGKRVRLFEDNQAVVAILRHQTTRAPEMMEELRRLFWILDSNDIQLYPEYIRSADNVYADRLSRIVDRDDWRLNPVKFRGYDQRWGPHTVDRFATANNKLCDRFNSEYRDPLSEGVDAFARSWKGENNWCNPPWRLLPQVVAKLRDEGTAATVVAPYWPSAPWFPALLEIAHQYDVLGATRDTFFPGRLGSCEPLDKPGWRVMVVRVEGRPATCTPPEQQ